jgi:hypothetical protein
MPGTGHDFRNRRNPGATTIPGIDLPSNPPNVNLTQVNI